jgi:hypothetical protein
MRRISRTCTYWYALSDAPGGPLHHFIIGRAPINFIERPEFANNMLYKREVDVSALDNDPSRFSHQTMSVLYYATIAGAGSIGIFLTCQL